jgi:hypothetical protein
LLFVAFVPGRDRLSIPLGMMGGNQRFEPLLHHGKFMAQAIDKGGGWRDNKDELICCGDDCPFVISEEGGNSAEI